jgi:DNA-binding beta-propeller fold protein YncE
VSQLFEGYNNIIEVINPSSYNITSTINLDFGLKPTTFDADTNYLWVPNSEGPNTIVIDTITDTIAYVDINLFDKSVSVGIDLTRKHAFILSSEYSFLRVIDSNNFGFITNIGLSDGYEGNIIYDSFNQIMVVNGRTNGTITLIDCETFSTSIFLTDKYIPTGNLLYCDNDNNIYFLNEIDNVVEVYNLSTLSPVNTYDLNPYGTPTNIVIDEEKFYLYVGFAPSTVVTFDLNEGLYLKTDFYSEIGYLGFINYNTYDNKLLQT